MTYNTIFCLLFQTAMNINVYLYPELAVIFISDIYIIIQLYL